MLAPGAVVGDYVLERRLGAGGMGTVWAARHRGLGALHALKLVPCASEEDGERFLREAEAAARLDGHPHTVRVHGAFVLAGHGVLATELIEGAEDLAARLRRTGPMPPDEALRLVAKVAGAVAHAHARGVLHRDLKPQNVLLDAAGEPRLVDLGVARLIDARSLTESGAVLGTPAFLAPEQARGERGDARADVFGLGALLWACLSGDAPRAGGSLAVLAQAATEPLPPLPRSVEPRLRALVARAAAFDPGARPASAAALAAELEALAAAPRGAGRGVRRLALVSGGLALLAAGALARWVWPRPAAPGPTSSVAPRGLLLRDALAILVEPGARAPAEVAAATSALQALGPGLERGPGANPAATPAADSGAGPGPGGARAQVRAARDELRGRLLRARWSEAEAEREERAASAALAALVAALGPQGAGGRTGSLLWAGALVEAAAQGDAAVVLAARRARAACAADPAASASLDGALRTRVEGLLGDPEAAAVPPLSVPLRLEVARLFLLGGEPASRPISAWVYRLCSRQADLGERPGRERVALLGLLVVRYGVSTAGRDWIGGLSGAWQAAASPGRLLACAELLSGRGVERAAEAERAGRGDAAWRALLRLAFAPPGSELGGVPEVRVSNDAKLREAALYELSRAPGPASARDLPRALAEESLDVARGYSLRRQRHDVVLAAAALLGRALGAHARAAEVLEADEREGELSERLLADTLLDRAEHEAAAGRTDRANRALDRCTRLSWLDQSPNLRLRLHVIRADCHARVEHWRAAEGELGQALHELDDDLVRAWGATADFPRVLLTVWRGRYGVANAQVRYEELRRDLPQEAWPELDRVARALKLQVAAPGR
ncbi:MAG: protein kinase [Planctomycetota bacterium]